MFCGCGGRMLASMSEMDPRADAPLADRSELGVSGLLPTGTVTLLLADVEGSSGWASLTPTERDVVRLVSQGLANNDIAIRLFVSPRTVQTHLTHVYTKLGLTSRVQLVQEAARHV
jgi:DNA-binding CsgD family transcriptional regulator